MSGAGSMYMVAPRTGAPEITVAENQLEYRPLVAGVYQDPAGSVMLLTRWRLDLAARHAVARGADVYLMQVTFGQPMQPVQIQVGPSGWVVDEEERERLGTNHLPAPSPVPGEPGALDLLRSALAYVVNAGPDQIRGADFWPEWFKLAQGAVNREARGSGPIEIGPLDFRALEHAANFLGDKLSRVSQPEELGGNTLAFDGHRLMADMLWSGHRHFAPAEDSGD